MPNREPRARPRHGHIQVSTRRPTRSGTILFFNKGRVVHRNPFPIPYCMYHALTALSTDLWGALSRASLAPDPVRTLIPCAAVGGGRDMHRLRTPSPILYPHAGRGGELSLARWHVGTPTHRFRTLLSALRLARKMRVCGWSWPSTFLASRDASTSSVCASWKRLDAWNRLARLLIEVSVSGCE